MRDKAFKISGDPKYDGYQRGLSSIASNFFDNKSSKSGVVNEPNYQPANELLKPIIRKFYSFFTDNIWGVDLAVMQSLSKCNKQNNYLLCAVKR